MSFEDRYSAWKEKRKEKTDGASFRERYIANQVKRGRINLEDEVSRLQDDIHSWQKSHDEYISGYNNRFTGEDSGYRSDSRDYLYGVKSKNQSLSAQLESIRQRLNDYGKYLDSTWVDNVTKTLDDSQGAYKTILDGATKDHQYWSQWASEDDYNNAVWEGDFYKLLQDGKYDEAEAMVAAKANGNLASLINPDVFGEIQEYGEIVKNAKEYAEYKPLIDKYDGMSKEELQGALEELKVAYHNAKTGTPSGADPLGLSQQSADSIEKEMGYVNSLIYKDSAANKYLDTLGKLIGKLDEIGGKVGLPIDSEQIISAVDNLKSLTALPKFTQDSALFEDGYQFGDVLGTAGASVADLGVNLLKGATGAVEGVVDLGAYGVAAAIDASGDKELADAIRRAATQSQSDQLWGGLHDAVNPYSISSNQADSMAQSLAQMYTIALTAGSAGLGTVGTTVLNSLGMGLSTMGSSMGEAYQGGADDWEAAAYGAMSGAVETVSEMLFGGLGKFVNALGFSKGISSLDDAFAKKLSDKISSQFWKNAVQFGVKAGAEGLEEVIAGFGSAIAKKMTYLSEEDLWKLVADERLLEAFVSGAVMSGFAQSGLIPGTKKGSFIESVQQGRDFITGLTADGQRYVDNEYAARLSEAENGGKKLSRREKLKLYDEVLKGVTIDEGTRNQFASIDQNARQQVTADIEKKISAEISDKKVRAQVAETLTKVAYGEHVSNAELRKVANSKKALKVLSELTGTKYKAGEVTVRDLRQAITPLQKTSARLSSANVLATYAAHFNMDEIAERSLMVSYAADVKNAGESAVIPPEVYAEAYNRAYVAGKKGTEISEISGKVSSVLSDSAIAQAYRAGEMVAAANAKSSAQGNAKAASKATTSKNDLLGSLEIGEIDSNKSYYKLDDLGISKEDQAAWVAAGIAQERNIRGEKIATVNTTVLQDELKRREKSSSKGLQNDGGSDTIESTQSRRENSDGESKQPGKQAGSDRRAESGSHKIQSGTREKDGRGSRVQKEVGGAPQKTGKILGTANEGLYRVASDQNTIPFDSNDIVNSTRNDILDEQHRVVNEYGVDCFVVKKDAWEKLNHDGPAGACKGKVYMSEDISSELLPTMAPHEGTHIMKQLKYPRYLDFIDQTPGMLDFSSDETADLLDWICDHIGVNYLSMSVSESTRMYDEMNAAIYGFYKAGMFESEGLSEWVPQAFHDFDAYIAELDSIHEQYKQEVREQREALLDQEFDEDTSDVQHAHSSGSSWNAERIKDGKAKEAKPVSEIVEEIRRKFGINITKGHVRGKNVLGQYNRRDHGIRTKIANDLPTVSHELGHALDQRYGLTDKSKLSREMRSELINALGDLKDAYKQNLWVSEGLAEYMRRFLQNRDDAARAYPEFTKYFLNSLSKTDRVLMDTFADEINAYYALDADTATSSIRLREEGTPDARTPLEKAREMGDDIYQAWVDANHGIRLFDEATGADTYKLASNAAYSDAIAGQIIVGDLTDANGQYVAPGLKAALEGVDIGNKKTYREFGEYLVLKHGPERLNEGMMIFADPRKNTTAFMEKRVAELENSHPEFKEAADRLYDFQKAFLQTWVVDTGLISAEVAEKWFDRWDFYVPFNRAVGKAGTAGAKKGYANQNSTIKKAIGSGLDIVHPVDNIINNIVKMVNAGVRNNVMLEITNKATEMGANATFLEKVPTPMKKKTADLTGVKAKLYDALEAFFDNGDGADSNSWSNIDEIIESSIADVLIQYGQGKAHGDVVTVLRNGKQEFWKINDALLLESLTSLSQKKMNGIMEAYAVVSRFMTSNITGNNIVWSIFSNFPRDLMTFFTYSKQKNPLKAFPAMGEAYLNKITGGNADTKHLPYIKEYYALGGGQTSAYTADVDLAKRARKKLKTTTKWQSATYYFNPLNTLSFISETVESGPRISTYIMMREQGMSPQEAFYESQDITVNFKRGGRLAREFNKVVPFFNASVQGLDKFKRWITCADVPRAQRSKAIVGRVAMYVAVSAALGALMYAINNADDDDEENYRLLSNYTKNTYWNIPLGDGKYFAIPKPREIAVLSTFAETSCEYFGGNDYAYDEFGDYVADNFLPPFVSDFVTDGMDGALGSLGMIGVTSDLKANKDFLGRPIESASLQAYESRDRYTRRTSYIAYWLGQAAAELGLDWSPVQIDYFFSQTLGGYWKWQKALFPVGRENVDWTLGVQNTYVKDNQYSNDIINWMYTQADESAMAHKSNPDDMDIAIGAKLDSNMQSFYSKYYALTKNKKETAESRIVKRAVLDMISGYRTVRDSGDHSAAEEAVYEVVRSTKDTGLLPAVMQTTVKDGEKNEITLTDVEYYEYQTRYNALYWEFIESNLGGAKTDEEKIAIIEQAQSIAKSRATEEILNKAGGVSSGEFEKYPGIDDSDLVTFKTQVSIEIDRDGGLTQEELIDILEKMVADGLSKKDAYTLFKSRYPNSDKNNPWRSYAP